MKNEKYGSGKYMPIIMEAYAAAGKAYCPYSRFHVGAALLTPEGKIYRGCNVENASYGGTICAERAAAVKAVSEGERNFSAIAVIGYKEGEEKPDFCMPCGICRQFLSEFSADGSMEIIVTDKKQISVYTLCELLPAAFK